MEALVMIGINLLIGAALWGIGMLLRKPVHREGPRADKEVQVSSYGLPIPLLYGQTKTAMQLIWATNLREHRHEENVGKGGGGTVVTYTYSCSWAGTFGVAPDSAIFGERQLLKLWIDSKLALNKMADADKVTASGSMKRFKFYSGSMTQLPDPTMQAVLGVANVPAYRGLCYGVYNDLNVTPYGNRIPTIRALTGPGTAADPSIYPVTGFVNDPNEAIYLQNPMAMKFASDGIFLITLLQGYADPPDDGYGIWRKINTITREIVTEKIYYGIDAPGSDLVPGYCQYTRPFVDYHGFDLDELNYIYVVAAVGYGPAVKLDPHTFTVIAQSPDACYQGTTWYPDDDIYANGFWEEIRVSKNPLYPYAYGWHWEDRSVFLMDRDTLANPFDPDSFGFQFNFTDSNYTWHATIGAIVRNDDGSWMGLYQYQDGSAVYTAKLARLYPNGGMTTIDITTSLDDAGYEYATQSRDSIAYDYDSDQIIISNMAGNGNLVFLDGTTGALNGVTADGIGPNSSQMYIGTFQNNPHNGYFYVARYDTNKILKIDINTRELVEEWDISGSIGDAGWLDDIAYVPAKNSVYANFLNNDGIQLHEVLIERITIGTALLANVVTNLCKRAGFTDAELNVAQLTDEVKGYAVDEDVSARQSLEPLMEAFIFDSTEVDGVMEFIKRGGVSVATIPEDDLGACQFGADRTVLAEITDQNELNLPRRVQVFYPDINRKHEQGVQYYDRQLTDSKKVKDITTKVLMDKDQAKQLAHISFKYDWTSMPVEFSVGPKWAKLRAADVVTLSKTEGDYRVLLLEGRSEGLRTTWKGAVESSSYISDILGEQLPMPYEDVFFPGPSLYQLMDLPPLLEAHDQAGIYMASGALFSYWTGCTVYVSKDAGNSWTFLKDISDRSVTGVALDALPDFAYNRLDEENSLIVRWDMESDVLASKTTAEFWNSQAHYLLVGDEIVCAKDVVTNADGTQTFGPPLIRGARGTEYAKSSHAAGERVIVLSMATTYFAALDSSYLNQNYLYNGISHGNEWEDGSKRMFPTELRTLKPWAGVQAEGTRDGINNLTITWRRRDRFGHLNPLRAGVEVPMSEATEAYEIDILDSGTVVRTITGISDESANYTAAQQTADGLIPGDSIDCEIFQLSATTGRGWELAATI